LGSFASLICTFNYYNLAFVQCQNYKLAKIKIC
jgi:hypothetical protein